MELPIRSPQWPRAITELVDTKDLPSLGDQTRESVRSAVLPADEELFEGQAVDASMAEACKSGLLLWLDELDRSHDISQSLHDSTGSYWHGIMHRREGDYSNAKYWFNRTGDHPVFRRTATWVSENIDPSFLESEFAGEWTAAGFVDACQRASRKSNSATTQSLTLIAAAEWILLFDDCYKRAIGESAAQ